MARPASGTGNNTGNVTGNGTGNVPGTGPQPRTRMPSGMRLALAGAAALALTGLAAFWLAARLAPEADRSGEIAVTITDSACEPAELTVDAGQRSFRITNASNRVLEWEILDGVMVVAERENIAPGLQTTLTQRLKPGEYQITCGLLSNPRGTLTVLATAESAARAAAPEPRAFLAALSEYRVFLTRHAGALATRTATLQQQIAAGDLPGAQAAWLAARQEWRQLAPVTGLFADLVQRMDPQAAYLAAREADPAFTGFHRLEYGLWRQRSLDGLLPVAEALTADAEELKARARSLTVPPEGLAGLAASAATLAADRVEASAGAGAGGATDAGAGGGGSAIEGATEGTTGGAPNGVTGGAADGAAEAATGDTAGGTIGGTNPGTALVSDSETAELAAELAGIARPLALVTPVLAEARPEAAAGLTAALDTAAARLAELRQDGALPPWSRVPPDRRAELASAFRAIASAAAQVNPALGLE